MNEFQLRHLDTLAAKAVDALTKNNFNASYVKSKQEAVEKLLALIPANAAIGLGGSWTVTVELALGDILEKRGHIVYNHNKPGITPQEAAICREKQQTADVFLCGTNALTLDGKLVNVDAVGNRVAAMIYGPKKVIVVAGINKIVRDVQEAERRIELHAAPVNNIRLGKPNPCVQAGMCMDCQSPTRICNITTIIRKRPALTDFHVLLVGEQLGF